MSLTNIDEFYQKECDKIDANCINAYVDFHLDEERDTFLCLDTSWGGDCLDLTSIVKAAETCTSLYISPTVDPNCLVYEGECENYCIDGDDLSRIISMTKLKDVDQETAPTNGDVYMFKDGKFYTFNLQNFVDNTNNTIKNMQSHIENLETRMEKVEGDIINLGNRITKVEGDIVNLDNRLTKVENDIEPILKRWHEPDDIPESAKIAFSNVNFYSDVNADIASDGTVKSLDKSHGVYGHALATDKLDDEIFG